MRRHWWRCSKTGPRAAGRP
ncbi:Hypothetical protein GQ85_012 [Rhodococcus rhodochrous]|nr:hypothetical protein KTR9_5084 [Gordonia sp. KTR9]ART90630.1 hypothetical protein [Rhodococcus rhodochrous]OOL33116.1 Hypothetical protein GQ85_012 [Rhodococcus rhodochrous]